ncbi:glycosyl hydrolase family 16 [Winogradskyella jejuensis]|uniref:Glycosyl hydrolase family 16 n=1 Tax=Winogradskyella jejuensis TaxID=1089305 RepID=A0A1M5LM40_9FLAO|nr:glycosyl hydrolase family 16 [Winogradskyella jejuensis]SHG66118.1 hypothetical protein SAMN05444148_0661 [Winogradskyella jejuensis]
MKKVNNIYKALTVICSASLILGCERGLSEEVEFASFPNNGDIFTDAPVGLTDEFFISFDPAAGANTEGFGTDDNVAFEGRSSIRIDVPSPNDPNGNFIGGIFLDRGDGRDLSGFDALTFWAKGSTTAAVGLVGFGNDFEENKFSVGQSNIQLSTDWRKYTIPIPDPSKLIQERGLFAFSAGGLDVVDTVPNGNEIGFTFWIDELRFEKLGTVAQPRPRIFGGANLTEQAFTGSTILVSGLSQTFNLEDGSNSTVGLAPSYFDFESSNLDVAIVNELGEITIIGEGTATITAQLAGVLAEGSLEISTSGGLDPAPTPMQPQANVLSVFSDAYTNVVTPNFTPGFGGSTTEASVSSNGGDEFVTYANNNFTGILFDDNPIDASAMQFMHVDIYVQEASTSSIEFQIRDIGANQTINTNVNNGFPELDDVDFRFTATGLTPGQWTSFEIPLSGDLATQKNNLGAIILVGGPDFILDNIYFYSN